LVILVPAVGAVAVTFLVTKFAPEARGHGVPEVMDAIYYATVQAIVLGQLTAAGLLALLFLCKLLATTVSLGSGASGGVLSPSLFMGATIGGAFASAMTAVHVPLEINVPAFAMVGMGAMVGGGTGAAMTAVTMIFEMTRDYNIVLPMILAVAFSLGVRRLLSPENIYTLKVARRGHLVPKASHSNMFLVRRELEVMETDILVLPAETPLRRLPQPPRPRRPDAARHRLPQQPHIRRRARQYRIAPRPRRRPYRNHPGRRRPTQFHDRARRRCGF
jgi:H+/Cl- antiporter ClcA